MIAEHKISQRMLTTHPEETSGGSGEVVMEERQPENDKGVQVVPCQVPVGIQVTTSNQHKGNKNT